MIKRLGVVLVVTCVIGISTPATAYAYDGNTAAQYAMNWAFGANPNYPGPFPSDCTNFASQALHEGGYPFVNVGDYSAYAWWADYDLLHWNWSNSWSVANDLRNFLLCTYPGGSDWGIECSGVGCYQDYVNDAYPGDILFYDWGDGLGWSHATVEVAWQGTRRKRLLLAW